MHFPMTFANFLEIHWLRVDKKRPSRVKKWFKLSDSNGAELIEKCQKLEDVENALQDKCRKPTYRYTKAEMLRLQDHPLSQKPPIIADSLKSLCGKTASKDDQDSKKDQQYKKTTPRTFAQGKKHDGKENDMSRLREKPTVTFRNEKLDERKPTDPAARIRKEQDICLSPQRKSFTTGCFVQNAKGDTTEATGNSSRKNSESNSTGSRERNDSHEENREKREIRGDHRTRDHRESKDNRNSREPPRRIGSGRLMLPSDPPFVIKGYPESRQVSKDKPTVVYKCTFQGKTNDREKDSVWNRQKNNNFFERRKNQYSDHSHDDDNNKYGFWDQHRNNNYFERRRPYHNDYHRDDEEEKEPEWMKEGPGSKNDMIELKGFDESVERFFRGGRRNRFNQEPNKNTQSENTEISKRASESDTSSVVSDSVSEKPQDKSPESKVSSKTIPENTSEKPAEEKSVKPLENHSIELNLDEIFKEPLLDLNSGVDSKESAGSKFTRWFKRDDATSTNAVTSANLNESLQSLIGGASDQSNKVPVPTNSVSPADPANQQNVYAHSSNLLNLLRGSQENTSPSKMDVRALEATGKLHSLEEIEAKWRGAENNLPASMNSAAAVDRKKKEEEAEAFKKLLSQAVKHDESMNAANDNRFPIQKDKNESGSQFQPKTDLSSLFCNGDAHPNFPPNMLPPQVSRMMPLNNVKQMPMQQNKQEMLTKMFMSSNNNFVSSPQQPGLRAPNTPMSSGVFSPISPEIQSRINEYQPTREVLQRQETMNMLKALKKGDLTVHHLVEQYKKTTPSQLKFRESVICVLKIVQQPPYANSSPYMGSPMGMSFNMPPPPHSSTLPFNENVMQQMMMNSQYRSGVPNIVYQRDFSGPNQNMFQSNMNKKLQAEQAPNMNQMPARMNSPLTIGVSSMSNVPGSNSMSPSGSMNLSRDAKNNAVLSMKSSSTSQSHSFTPISVLRQLSADKENLDTMSRDSKDAKLGDLSVVYSQANAGNMSHSNSSSGFTSALNNTMQWNAAKQMSGEKSALVPYSASSSNPCNSVCISAGVIEHLSSFGSCIPPPAISGQYFVGNMIRPSNMSSSIPIFSNPPPPILSRLPVTPSANLVAKGSQKYSINPSQLQQMQQMRAISSHIPQSHESYVSSANRTSSDGIISSSACGNQTAAMRNSFMNGLIPSGDDQLNRLFSNSNLNNPSFPLSNSNVPVSVPNIISVEEIERMQQSVRN